MVGHFIILQSGNLVIRKPLNHGWRSASALRLPRCFDAALAAEVFGGDAKAS
jgi:hypothetical protein